LPRELVFGEFAESDRNVAETIVGKCLQLGLCFFERGAFDDQPEVARVDLLVVFPNEAGVEELFEPLELLL